MEASNKMWQNKKAMMLRCSRIKTIIKHRGRRQYIRHTHTYAHTQMFKSIYRIT